MKSSKELVELTMLSLFLFCARHSSSSRLVQGASSASVMAFAHCSTELSFLSTLAARLELALVEYEKTRMSLHPLERVMA